MLGELKQALEDCDTESSHIAARLLDSVEPGAQKKTVEALIKHLDNYDYDQALVELNTLDVATS